jgi:hypothetical protein
VGKLSVGLRGAGWQVRCMEDERDRHGDGCGCIFPSMSNDDEQLSNHADVPLQDEKWEKNLGVVPLVRV